MDYTYTDLSQLSRMLGVDVTSLSFASNGLSALRQKDGTGNQGETGNLN